jgi:uncharacterized protein YndB with AHSA1/START domain
METKIGTIVVVQATINAPIDKIWEYWTNPGDITRWNHASDDWHSPRAENDLRTGGKFNIRMEARDGSAGFDFWGSYTKVILNKLIEYTMGDGRKVKIQFVLRDNKTEVIESFETENENSVELQRTGWQAILDNFKKYAEKQVKLYQNGK